MADESLYRLLIGGMRISPKNCLPEVFVNRQGLEDISNTSNKPNRGKETKKMKPKSMVSLADSGAPLPVGEKDN